jgi:beta-glucosidase
MDINNLLKTLTLDEKIGQLMQLPPFFFIEDIDVKIFGQVNALNLNKKKIFEAGSVLGNNNAEQMIEIQKKYLSQSRHKIPLMFMADVVHGFKTIFPVPLAIAASWHTELATKAAEIQAKESRTSGIQVTFSPMVDISRDPRWGRIVESFGEDPYLSSRFSEATVKGYQGHDVSSDDHVAACVKHFAAYGASEAGRDYNTVDVSHYALHNTYLPSYKAAIDAGVKMIMTSFNTIDAVPATVNKFILQEILRDKWQYDGVVISDYDSLHQIVAHGVAENDKEAALRGIEAGLDIEMASTCYTNHLSTLIKEQKIHEKTIDDAVLRILQLKKDLGLFENPYQGANVERQRKIIRCEKHLDMAQKIAEESIVLLKNDHSVLPLKSNLTYAILGPYAETNKTNGAWAGHGDNNLNSKLSDILSNKDIKLNFIKASLEPIYTSEEIKMIEQADQIILALGEDEYESGEAHSKVDVKLPRAQEKFVNFIKQLNKKTIVLLYHGRPFVLSNIMTADAILDTFYLGSRANQAIANILCGDVNPSGKLPVSYPRHGGQIPLYYNQLNTGRPHERGVYAEYTSFYLDEENEPLFPFGFGISYSKFKYSNLSVSRKEIGIQDNLIVSIDVFNDSPVDGYEIVQCYVNDMFSYYARPTKELIRFKKIWIKAHTKVTINFDISAQDLSYYGPHGEKLLEPGTFKFMVGPNSETFDSVVIKLLEVTNHAN